MHAAETTEVQASVIAPVTRDCIIERVKLCQFSNDNEWMKSACYGFNSRDECGFAVIFLLLCCLYPFALLEKIA